MLTGAGFSPDKIIISEVFSGQVYLTRAEK
jgi:hypothetical protein